jgi:ubiquinol-cytochrome c reductase cytochrome b subunit
VDNRLNTTGAVRRAANRVFPDHWSFALGEVAAYCLVILILTGTYLTFFYDSSDIHVIYHGRYVPLDGVPMTDAFKSTVDISFDARGGLLIRQVHHWTALLFFAVLVLHLARCFFTGAYRRPRVVNWFLGVLMFVVALVEGYSGYVLPDDVLSGASLQIARSVVQSIPIVGTWLLFLIQGGPFPGPKLLTRLYIAHVLLLPGILLALVAVHLLLVVQQGHTQPWSRHATEKQVQGRRFFPDYVVRAGARFVLVSAILCGLGGLAQINPIWMYGPYEPAAVTANSQSDWYFFFLEGSLRLWPPWEIRAFHHTVPAVFFPGVILPVLIFTLTAFYPLIERRFTGDRTRHHVLQRPRDAPVRTGIGASGLTFWVILELTATDDQIAALFHVPIEALRWTLRVGVIVFPAIAFAVGYAICKRRKRAENRPPADVPGRFVRTSEGIVVEEPVEKALR